MSNREIEDFAIQYVLQLEQAAGRDPRDARTSGAPVDVISPPRMIEIKAFAGMARGQAIPLEQRQVDALRRDHQNFYLYVVDNIGSASAGLGESNVLVLDGGAVAAMVDRTNPTTTYWPTLWVADYDNAPRLAPPPASLSDANDS